MDPNLRSQLVILSDRLAVAAALFGAMADDITKALIRADAIAASSADSDATDDAPAL